MSTVPSAAAAAPVRVPPALLQVRNEGPAPLLGADAASAAAEAPLLRIALVGPGNAAIVDALEAELVNLGHDVSRWPRRQTRMEEWAGADVAVALSPRAAWRVLSLPDVAARALLLPADEELRLGASAERIWTSQALAAGLHVLCAGDALADRIQARHGATVSSFRLGVDRAYRSLPTHRRPDVVLLDAPIELPWRGAGLALLAGAELSDRHPELELVVARGARAVALPYDARDLGPTDPADAESRARDYSEATVAIVCASDGLDPVVTDMLACGLPVIVLEDVAGDAPAPLSLRSAAPDPVALAEAAVAAIGDLVGRAEQSLTGTNWAAEQTWSAAGHSFVAGLRDALRLAAG